jgi:hypothetical protein
MNEICMSTYLMNKTRRARRMTAGFYMVAAVVGAAGILAGVVAGPFFYLLTLLSVGLLLSRAGSTRSWQWGEAGEERLRRRLRCILDDQSSLFCNLPVPGGDLDCVVVTGQGVWAFESKFYTGEVWCTDGHWCRIRRRDGESYPEDMRSPSEQLSAGIMHLKSYLASQGISTWIRGIVVFTHPGASLHVKGLSNVSAMTLSDLAGLPPGPQLSEPTRKAIEEALLKLQAPATVKKCA